MLTSTENVTELKFFTEAAVHQIFNKFDEGSRTFCKSSKDRCKSRLKISEVRMLTWVTLNHVKIMIAESSRFSANRKSMRSKSAPKKKATACIRWVQEKISWYEKKWRICLFFMESSDFFIKNNKFLETTFLLYF